ncbi:hypothetical protein SAMN05216571_112101 [Onishia taeanensis]|uniref:Uncharacterized protein n=1 Tax=Onishia taeanensis TaxID=284577 RepID=A0A1G7U329_9GAMM|nr:hypothetical protein [Halomonas taeanensis]SDG41469.1 hypothetical protein SAMN05216571_112101 [Halomonas taeanensis]
MENWETWISIVSLIGSIASLVLAVIAIWITLHIKRETDRVSERTIDVLTEVKSDAKSVAQVAMPELRAYGDSMRRFILSSNNANAENSQDESGFFEKLEEVEARLKGLESENDISKLKAELKDVSSAIADSELDFLKEASHRKKRNRVGVRISFPSNSAIETSSPNESWQELLKHAMAFGATKVNRDEYGKKWVLINKASGKIIPKKFITDETADFSDVGLTIGDELTWSDLE